MPSCSVTAMAEGLGFGCLQWAHFPRRKKSKDRGHHRATTATSLWKFPSSTFLSLPGLVLPCKTVCAGWADFSLKKKKPNRKKRKRKPCTVDSQPFLICPPFLLSSSQCFLRLACWITLSTLWRIKNIASGEVRDGVDLLNWFFSKWPNEVNGKNVPTKNQKPNNSTLQSVCYKQPTGSRMKHTANAWTDTITR